MKRLVLAGLVAAAAVLSTGCVVVPARPVAPVYVAPAYPMPAPGYVWEFHPHYGWGWHHPQYGWHQGWR